MSSVLNFTPSCQCGKVKSKSRQWCESCFNLLSERDKESFYRHSSGLRRRISSLQVKINVTLMSEQNEVVDLREPAIGEY